MQKNDVIWKIFDYNSLGANQEGKIFIKSPSFCGGYLNESESILIDKDGKEFGRVVGEIDFVDKELIKIVIIFAEKPLKR